MGRLLPPPPAAFLIGKPPRTGDPSRSAATAQDQKFAPSLWDARRTSTHRSMFIVAYGAPEGYEWFVALVVLVGL